MRKNYYFPHGRYDDCNAVLCAAAVGAVLVASRYLFAKIGPNGTQIVIRFMGMILCSIAMQFMIDGVGQLLPGVLDAHFLGGLSK